MHANDDMNNNMLMHSSSSSAMSVPTGAASAAAAAAALHHSASSLSATTGLDASANSSAGGGGRQRQRRSSPKLQQQQQEDSLQQKNNSRHLKKTMSRPQLTASTSGLSAVAMLSAVQPATTTLMQEFWVSTDLLFQSKLTWLLLLGPLAVLGDATGTFGEALCFFCSGIALIPCAERLSFVTEQVAEHTNGTIGALLNATFGNAPELLISVAALRSGYYRVVQLAMLGSMLTNLLFVFGVSCFIGGLRYQVQTLRKVSGNVNVVMLYVATAGSLFPAALSLANQYKAVEESGDSTTTTSTAASLLSVVKVPTPDEITFSRVNAVVMLFMYLCFLLFQLGTHKEEFDDDQNVAGAGSKAAASPSRRNLMCISFRARLEECGKRILTSITSRITGRGVTRKTSAKVTVKETVSLLQSRTKRNRPLMAVELINDDDYANTNLGYLSTDEEDENDRVDIEDPLVLPSSSSSPEKVPLTTTTSASTTSTTIGFNQRRRSQNGNETPRSAGLRPPIRRSRGHFDGSHKSKDSDRSLTETGEDSSESDGSDHDIDIDDGEDIEMENLVDIDEYDNLGGHTTDDDISHDHHSLHKQTSSVGHRGGPLISMRIGVLWLFIITLCISAMSDILVDTIDGFAQRMHLSPVFTSMVIIPFFSNIAEQVSAFLFAFRNEMDLCIGVTIGSAIQILTFVMPGSVLIGMMMDRSMTLYFHGYETVCLVFAVVVVGSVLQNGTTNWLTGAMLVGIYVMLASGIWFHELEDLTVDTEQVYRNITEAATQGPT